MSSGLRRRLGWLAVIVGIAAAVGLTVWLDDQLKVGVLTQEEPWFADEGEGGKRTGKLPPRPRLRIPEIDVAAHAVDLGLNPDGTLEVPKDYDEVGLWKNGPAPGERGPALIAGHVDSITAPAVFYRLRKLRPGDRIRWEGDDGRIATFKVTRTEEHPKAEFPTARVYGKTRRRELRLVTCSGPADASGRRSLNNLIVFARAV
jgi:sortase (surface protein transpeptidase)